MESDKKVRRFNAVRRSIIAILIVGFLSFPLFKLLPPSYEYLVLVHVAFFVVVLVIVIGRLYRCPFCNSIPRGHPIPYVDLAPRSCRVCGHSFTASDNNESGESTS